MTTTPEPYTLFHHINGQKVQGESEQTFFRMMPAMPRPGCPLAP